LSGTFSPPHESWQFWSLSSSEKAGSTHDTVPIIPVQVVSDDTATSRDEVPEGRPLEERSTAIDSVSPRCIMPVVSPQHVVVLKEQA